MHQTHAAFCLIFSLFFSVFCFSASARAQDADPAAPLTFADAITLDNGKIKIQIAPSVGRVVWFGLSNQENLLWLDTPAIYDNPRISPTTGQKYYNIGGDKIWVSPQDMWIHATGNKRWPPDGVLDGSPWSLLAQDATSITIQSPPSPHFGVQITRRFELLSGSYQLTIRNTVKRLSRHPIPVMIWSITQVKQPHAVLLDLDPRRPKLEQTYCKMKVPSDDLLEQAIRQVNGDNGAIALNNRVLTKVEFKIGTLGCWIAAIYDHVVFRQSTTFDPDGAYPEVSNVQTYTSSESPFAEIELLSPQSHPHAGQAIDNTVIWELLPIANPQSAQSLVMRLDPVAP
jgi:hypothetical protein